MVVYMLKNRLSGRWYKRGPSWSHRWVEQEKASIWPTKTGPASVKGQLPEKLRPELEIVSFKLVPLESE